MNLQLRAFSALNLAQYCRENKVDICDYVDLTPPSKRQYVLRLLIKNTHSTYQIPKDLEWVKPMLHISDENQKAIGVVQPFVYLTVRHGVVTSEQDDAWHVDGFSMKTTHLPEQNYIWTDVKPTEYIEQSFNIPQEFNPLRHNIHKFFQKNVDEAKVLTMEPKRVYGLDPYIVHRRPLGTYGLQRTFIRISYIQQEVIDCNNTFNPLLPTNYQRDGVKLFREKLEEL